jgi:hypothetical protein
MRTPSSPVLSELTYTTVSDVLKEVGAVSISQEVPGGETCVLGRCSLFSSLVAVVFVFPFSLAITKR